MHHGHSQGTKQAKPTKKKRLKKIVIVGTPNVGKSVLFNNLTGQYATVSNYPGTTVEVFSGVGVFDHLDFEVIDTPGMYSLFPITEDERVARRILLEEKADVILHVVDAKNLDRMLPLTIQLIEAGLPVILVLNMMDEAREAGLVIDSAKIGEILGIPVVETVSITGEGMSKLRRRIVEVASGRYSFKMRKMTHYGELLENVIDKIEKKLEKGNFSKRILAQLILAEDEEILRMIGGGREFKRIVDEARKIIGKPLNYVIEKRLHGIANEIYGKVVFKSTRTRGRISERLGNALIKPLTGIPLIILILVFFYLFVGVLGAQIMVDFLENVFEQYINPLVDNFLAAYLPTPFNELFAGEYGIITLGVRYAVAIILPIVSTFFIAFSILEDVGVLPRIASLVNVIFERIGLNGRAVIPMLLGTGCDTMATVATRTLETKRERLIATLLLALAVPCSAQLGVIFAILSDNQLYTTIWGLIVVLILFLIGYLSSKIVSGENPGFYMEIPPIRRPLLSNVLMKTYLRLEWYLFEVFPLFILASFLIWVGKLTGVFQIFVQGMSPIVAAIGLPREASVAFLFGFFRRDYGAAGLYDLKNTGVLTGRSVLVSAVTLTLFVPCIAQFLITIKERGLKAALAMFLFIFPFAFLVGYVLNTFLGLIGV